MTPEIRLTSSWDWFRLYSVFMSSRKQFHTWANRCGISILISMFPNHSTRSYVCWRKNVCKWTARMHANDIVECCKWMLLHQLLWNFRDKLQKWVKKWNYFKDQCKYDNGRCKLRVLLRCFLLFFSALSHFIHHRWRDQGTAYNSSKTSWTQIATVAWITFAISINQWLICQIISHHGEATQIFCNGYNSRRAFDATSS